MYCIFENNFKKKNKKIIVGKKDSVLQKQEKISKRIKNIIYLYNLYF